MTTTLTICEVFGNPAMHNLGCSTAEDEHSFCSECLSKMHALTAVHDLTNVSLRALLRLYYRRIQLPTCYLSAAINHDEQWYAFVVVKPSQRKMDSIRM